MTNKDVLDYFCYKEIRSGIPERIRSGKKIAC